LTSFCKSFGNFIWLQIIVAIIANSCYFYFFIKTTTKVFTGLLIYFLLDYLYFNTDIIRESISVGFCLVALVKWCNKKYILFYFFVLIATLFHFFAITFFLIPLVLTSRINSKIKIFFALISFIFLVSLQSATSTIGIIISLLNSDNDISIFSSFESSEISISGYIFNFMRVIPLLFIILYYSGKRKMSSLLIPKRIVLIFSYIFIYIVMLRVFAIPFLERLLNYVIFIIHLIHISISLDIARVYFTKSSRFIVILIFIFSSFFFYIAPFLTIHPLYGVRYYKIYYPYYSIFSEETDKDRELIIYKTGKE
jgi:hypothetical protein